jgi:maleamate amidohydrolase
MIWDSLLTETDREVIRLGGSGKPRGMGSRPAVMVIDPQYNYVGEDAPILESIKKWPSSGGAIAWKAIRQAKRIVDKAHEIGVPVIYTRQVQKKTVQFDGFQRKAARDTSTYLEGHKGTEIVEEIAPLPQDLVIDKSYASVFFGTPLISYLIAMKVDSLILTGGSTGGCVRATAVDGITRNFNVTLVQDALFDRIEASHKVALLDFWMKYGDVMETEEVLRYLDSLAN